MYNAQACGSAEQLHGYAQALRPLQQSVYACRSCKEMHRARTKGAHNGRTGEGVELAQYAHVWRLLREREKERDRQAHTHSQRERERARAREHTPPEREKEGTHARVRVRVGLT